VKNEIKNVLVLEKGIWTPDQIRVRQVKINQFQRDDEEARAIDDNWQKILAKNPQAFSGPTIRLVGRHCLRDRLVLEVVPSDYKESCFLGWLGVAMVPITRDGYLALQGHVSSISATVGEGMRVPGCTPKDTKVIPYLIEEMREEFGVRVAKDNLTILGLTEVKSPLSMPNSALVTKVKITQSRQELIKCWEKARERWEGELHFVKLDYERKKVSFQELGGSGMINPHSLLILGLVIENELNISNCISYWPRFTGTWQKTAAGR